jgi:hypothetical protein
VSTYTPRCGDVVRVDYETDDSPPRPTWYRAEVIRPSTQRAGDWEVRVIEVGPNCGVSVGVHLSPILGHGIELVFDDDAPTADLIESVCGPEGRTLACPPDMPCPIVGCCQRER